MLIPIIAALILSVASGLGVGSGGLLVVYLTLSSLAVPQNTAQSVNLILFIASAVTSAAVQRKNHALPNLKLITFLSFCAIPGVIIGSFVRNDMPLPMLKFVFGVFLITAGLSVLYSAVKRFVTEKKHPESRFSHKTEI